MYLFSKVCLKVKVFIVKNLKELPLCNGAHFCFYTQPGPKAAQSRGDYPWPQVLHWLWRKGGQPVHSGCQTGGQNRHGVQGTATKKKNYMLPMFCVQFYFWLSVLVLSTSVNNIVLENPTFFQCISWFTQTFRPDFEQLTNLQTTRQNSIALIHTSTCLIFLWSILYSMHTPTHASAPSNKAIPIPYNPVSPITKLCAAFQRER